MQKPYFSERVFVKQATSLFMMVRGFGFQLLYDRNGRIYLTLEPYYINKVTHKLRLAAAEIKFI